MSETNRWDGFSDEELRALRAGAVELQEVRSMSIASRNLANEVASELLKEMTRRETQQATYRGPGYYRHCTSLTYEVLGMAYGRVEDPRIAILRHLSGEYYYESEDDFEKPVDGKRRYEYLGPLEGKATAPTPAQVERAAQAMAQLSQGMTIEQKTYAFDIGDRAVAQTILNAALSS